MADLMKMFRMLPIHRYLLNKRCYFRCVPLAISNGVKLQSRDAKVDYEYFKGLKNSFHPETETPEPEINYSQISPTSTRIVQNTLKKFKVEEKSDDDDVNTVQTQKVRNSTIEHVILPSINNAENIPLKTPSELNVRHVEVQSIDADATLVHNVSSVKSKEEGMSYDSLDEDKTESRQKEFVGKKNFPRKKMSGKPKGFQSKVKLLNHVKFSEVLQEFGQIGVDLRRWETMRDVPEMILSKNFNRDVKPYIDFLIDNELPADQVGSFFTKNPYIFLFPVDNLQRRIDFYKSKNFLSETIGAMMSKAVFILNIKTSVVSGRLQHYQDEIKLSDDEIRDVITRQPKLITFDLSKIKICHQTLVTEFELTPTEIKTLFISKPKLWLTDLESIRSRLDYVHREMGISKHDISRCPEILLRRRFIIKQRHLFLKSINRADYNWPNENSVSLKDFIWCNDNDFCKVVAKTSVKEFRTFLKAL